MNTLFSLIGCPICAKASMAISKVNTELPPNRQIWEIKVLPQEVNGKFIGDPRLNFMAELHKSQSFQNWTFPILVIEDVGIVEKWNSLLMGVTGKMIVRSAYSEKHYETFLKEYMIYFRPQYYDQPQPIQQERPGLFSKVRSFFART